MKENINLRETKYLSIGAKMNSPKKFWISADFQSEFVEYYG